MTRIGRPTIPAWIVCAALLPGLSGCVTHHVGTPGDRELTAATASARLAFGQGRVELAAQLYIRALARARAMDDAGAIADAAYNLAACLTEMGQYQGARVQLDEAEAEAARAGVPVVDVLLVKAMVARLQQDPAGARAVAEQVLNQRPPPTGTERAQAHLIKAEAACDTGDSAAAADELGKAKIATVSSLPLRARAAAVLGRIRLLRNDWRGAATEFDREAELMRRAHRYHSMSAALAEAGRAYEAAGLNEAAADRYYRAARSAFGFGDTIKSVKLISAAQTAAKKAGAAGLEKRAESLSAEMREAASLK